MYPPDVVVAQDPCLTQGIRLLVIAVRSRHRDARRSARQRSRCRRDALARFSRVDYHALASTIPPGVIVRQTPPGGHQVHPGDPIGLEVSR
jgi:hypothetical protein